jgi:hypothetical protein
MTEPSPGRRGARVGRTTAPPRGFSASDWSVLDRERRRQLAHALLIEAGAEYASIERRAQHDDLIFVASPLLGARRMRIRVAHAPRSADDLAELAARAAREGLADFLLVGTATDDPELAAADHYLAANEVVELLEASALVTWSNGMPLADRESLTAAQSDPVGVELADSLGLRALAPLSRNKLPWRMRMTGVTGAPDDWFERVFFRTATAACGLTGRRFGTAARAQRVADGFLRQHGSARAVLYDCKAARDGYTMTADHERRLIEYAQRPVEHGGTTLKVGRVVIVSSGFPSGAARHPFHERRAALRAAGFDLAYLRATDLVAAALELRPALDVDTLTAAAVDWCTALDEGLVTRASLLAAVRAALADGTRC